MRSKLVKIMALTVTASLLGAGNIYPLVNVERLHAAAVQDISTQTVLVAGKSTIKVNDAHLLMQEQGKVLSFSVVFNNNGSRDMNLIDYWVRVKNKSGKSFSVKLAEKDKNKSYVSAGNSVTLTYYAVVDKQTQITDFKFEFIEWDFNVPNYERILGTISYPTNGSDQVAPYSAKTMLFDNTSIKGVIKQAIITQDKSNTYITANFEVENVGFKPASMANMSFFIQTDNGLVYDISSNDLANVSLQPREKQVITAQSIVPNSSGAKKYSLVPIIKESTNNVNIPIGMFLLPNITKLAATEIGKTRNLYYNGQTLITNLQDAIVNLDNSRQYVYVDFEIENAGTETLKAPDLTFKIKTKNGTTYNLIYDKENTEILIGEKKTIQLSAEVPEKVDLKNSELLLQTKNNKNLDIPAGLYNLPNSPALESTPVREFKNLSFNGNNVKTTVTDSFVSKVEESYHVFSSFQLENEGNEPINIAESSFSIKTKNGTNYPLTYAETELSLLPGIAKNIQLTGLIPENLDLATSELVVRLKHDKNKGFVISNYALEEKKQEEGNIGGNFKYGDYEVSVASVQRAYLEANDKLVADIKVTNTASGSRKLPTLSGYFVVNGVKISPDKTQTVQLDQLDILSSKGSYNYVVHADIPYTTDINQISFVVTELKDGKENKLLHQFTDTKTSSILKKEKNYTYEIATIGKKAEARLGKTAVYSDGKDSYFYSEIELTNKERRSITLNNLGGYIQAKNKAILPVTFSKYDEKIFPDGTVLLTAFTRIPNNYYVDEMEFYIGESITSDNDAETGSTLIKQVGFKLSKDDIVQNQPNLLEMNYLDYMININNMYASFHVREGSTQLHDFDGIQLNLHYDLLKLKDYENDFDKHKLHIEIVDTENKFVRYTKELVIDTLAQDAEYLEIGEGNVKKIVFKDEDVLFKLSQRKFVVNVYHEYDGVKLLIASKENVW